MTEKQTTLGVVIGRFQVAELHTGHRHLIDTVLNHHARLLIILGATGGQSTACDPLDVETRMQLIREQYPEAIVRMLRDQPTNEGWSQALDTLIASIAGENDAILYGSRDCFIDRYAGAFPTQAVPPIPDVSGSDLRTDLSKSPTSSADFRRGVIYAANKRFPTSYQAVDIVIIRLETGEVLLGWKSGDAGLRFPGGFVDPTDASLEAAAKREAYEETRGLEISTPRYVGSARINDHRYRKGPDAMMSAVFLASYIFGATRAGDDLERVEWVRIEDVEKRLASFHLPIWHIVKQHLTAMEK